MLGNPTLISWSYLVQEFFWCRVGFTAYLAVGGIWLPTYLTSFFKHFIY
jgi:hypothetical protein